MYKTLVLGTLAFGMIFAGMAVAHPAAYVNANVCPGGFFTSGAPVLGLQGCVSNTNCKNSLFEDIIYDENETPIDVDGDGNPEASIPPTPIHTPGTGFSQGGVRFCGTDSLTPHLVGDAEGKVTLTIIDDLFNPTGGAYCQDLNNNSVCGEKDPLAPAGVFIEPRVFVCAVVTIDSPFVAGSKTPAQWAAGDNWDPAKDALVFIDAVGNGNAFRGTLPSDPVNNPGPIPPSPAGHQCTDPNPYHGGVKGIVTHT